MLADASSHKLNYNLIIHRSGILLARRELAENENVRREYEK